MNSARAVLPNLQMLIFLWERFFLQDIRAIASPEDRKCITHSAACPLPSGLKAFGAGFSCTSLSSLNSEAGQNISAIAEQKESRLILFPAICRYPNSSWLVPFALLLLDASMAARSGSGFCRDVPWVQGNYR